MNAAVGERIAEERDRLGLSQAAFAERVGVSFSSQRRYENGSRSPSTVYLSNLRECAGIDVDYVLTGSRHSNMPQHRTILALRLAICEIGAQLGCEPEIVQHLAGYASVDPSIYQDGALIPEAVIDSFVKSCQANVDAVLLASIFEGVETATKAINAKLTSTKKGQVVAMLYRAFKSHRKIEPAMIEEAVKLASS